MKIIIASSPRCAVIGLLKLMPSHNAPPAIRQQILRIPSTLRTPLSEGSGLLYCSILQTFDDPYGDSMSVKIRLKRMGRKNHPFYRLNAIDSRAPRDGRVIEELGFYDPRNKDNGKQFVAKLDRCKHWLDVGAVPSETVSSLLKKAGVEHKQLKLPKPGKPKAAIAAPGEKKA
jgi:small subunit ribosomal protein S16